MDTLIEGLEMPKYRTLLEINPDGTVEEISPINNSRTRLDATAVSIPNHGDLADKRVIIEEMGDAYDALYDMVDKKALSECHVSFLRAVMAAPVVIAFNDGVLEGTK